MSDASVSANSGPDNLQAENERLHAELKRYSRHFLDTADVVNAFRADDRTALRHALRELGKSWDALMGDREALEEAVVPRD